MVEMKGVSVVAYGSLAGLSNHGLAFMFSALAACHLIRENPESNRPWLIAAPALLLTVALLAVMVDDLLS